MPDLNAHSLDPNWAEPGADQVQEFFDKISEKIVQCQEVQGESVRLTRATAAKKVVKAAVAKRKATASSSSKRPRTPPASPPLVDVDTEVIFDLGSLSPRRKRKAAEEEAEDEDVETQPQRVVKRARASTGGQPPAGAPSADQENIDIVIEEVARDAEAEANKIAAEEAAKNADEDAAKGPAGEAGKATAEEAGKGAAEEGAIDDQPSSFAASGSSKYLKKLHALHHAHLDKAKSRMAAVDKAEADLVGRVTETQAWFRQAHEELKVAQDLLAELKLELVMKQADIEKAQQLVKEQAAKDEAARHQHQAELNSQEEDPAAREEKLTATLHGKDEEGENLWVTCLADVACRITT
nr:translation initiation factor IF-2-like [Aegilops tauschii subsp. strangulata]